MSLEYKPRIIKGPLLQGITPFFLYACFAEGCTFRLCDTDPTENQCKW